jgi:hypothetical protein
MFTTVKVSEMTEEIGLDESIHGEHAYEDVFVGDDLADAVNQAHAEALAKRK